MSYPFSPELARLVQERMSTGRYESEDDLLLNAILALDDVETRHKQLKQEIADRLEGWDSSTAIKLDRDAVKTEGRARLDARG